MLVLFLSWSSEIKSLLNKMVLFTPESRIKITLLILTGTTINLFMASKEKVCLWLPSENTKSDYVLA